MFTFLHETAPSLDGAGLRLHPWAVGNQKTKFDLHLVVMDQGPELTGLLEYKTDLFDASRITAIVTHFQDLLLNIVASPTECVSYLLPPALDNLAKQIPTQEPTRIQRTPASPQNALEHQLLSVWERVFGFHPIGTRDDFFALGGTSSSGYAYV